MHVYSCICRYIKVSTGIHRYIIVCKGIASICRYKRMSRYCMYLQVFNVLVGISVYVGITGIRRYRKYIQVCLYLYVLHVLVGIACKRRYMQVYQYMQVLYVFVGIWQYLHVFLNQYHAHTYAYRHIPTHSDIPTIVTDTACHYHVGIFFRYLQILNPLFHIPTHTYQEDH